MTISSWPSGPGSGDPGLPDALRPGRKPTRLAAVNEFKDEFEKTRGASPMSQSTRMGTTAMQSLRDSRSRSARLLVLIAVALPTLGCYNPPVDVSQTPAPFRFRLKKGEELSGKWEDEVTGGQLFSMYCGYCHNARAIGERPFSNYQNVAGSHASPGPDDRRGAGQDRGLLPPLARRSAGERADRAVAQAADLLAADSRAPRGVAGGRQGGREGQGRTGSRDSAYPGRAVASAGPGPFPANP